MATILPERNLQGIAVGQGQGGGAHRPRFSMVGDEVAAPGMAGGVCKFV